MDSPFWDLVTIWLARASGVMVLTGAGISAESGVPTFRGKDGLWNRFRPEELATLEALQRDPERVWTWYRWRRKKVLQAQPNPAHRALVTLEQWKQPHFLLVTQNVDGLHQRAGSQAVVEFHGNLFEDVCLQCGFHRRIESVASEDSAVPYCPRCGHLLKPGVVMFGEPIPEQALHHVIEFIPRTDILLVIGTSAQVYPAAAIPRWVKDHGGKVVEVNPEQTPVTEMADAFLRGPAGKLVPKLVQDAMKKQQVPHERTFSG